MRSGSLQALFVYLEDESLFAIPTLYNTVTKIIDKVFDTYVTTVEKSFLSDSAPLLRPRHLHASDSGGGLTDFDSSTSSEFSNERICREVATEVLPSLCARVQAVRQRATQYVSTIVRAIPSLLWNDTALGTLLDMMQGVSQSLSDFQDFGVEVSFVFLCSFSPSSYLTK